MRNVVVALLAVGALVLVVGLASRAARIDVDYLVGTWHNASALVVAVIVAALIVLAGLVSAVVVDLRSAGDRRTLEAELQRTYVRLRAAEAPGAAQNAPAPGGDDEPAARS